MEHEAESRLVALETKLSYMEDFVAQLQAVCVEHTTELEQLRSENTLLRGRLHELAAVLEGEIPNRRPPHY